MKKSEKIEIVNLINQVINFCSTKYNVSSTPNVEIVSTTNFNACGKFISKSNKILIKTTTCDKDTIAHEIAHFIQNCLEGDTYCLEMKHSIKIDSNYKLAIKHYHLTQEIIKIGNGLEIWKKINRYFE